ncbi:ATP-binding protein [Dehalogenimonas sp. 4OHTPN]|uniref:ATP-binding protein n=1 Tax=Dehalogenimonas sp. 4OHTPN TaxID=3166643 RepID=A0AAU8G9U3_9CHLR
MLVKAEELLARDVLRLRRAIFKQPPQKVQSPAFIILVGLPGSGKSFFACKLTERIPAVVLESDFLRKSLVRRPVYSRLESYRLFRAIHVVARELLLGKHNVVLDATNLSEESRQPLFSIAAATGAEPIVVYLSTPRETAQARLIDRMSRRDGYSDADWEVYQKLEASYEPIREPHHEVKNAMDISAVIDRIIAQTSGNS